MGITINGTANTVAGLAAGGLPDNTVDGGNLAMGSDAAGDILYYNGTDYIRLAKGTDGQVLTLASGVPTWAAASGGDNTPAFTAYMDTDQNIANDTDVIVVFNQEVYDTDSAYNTSTGEFTVPSGKAGKYFLSAQVVVDDVDTGYERVEIFPYKNGSRFSILDRSFPVYSSNASQQCGTSMNAIYDLAAGDVIKIAALQNAGQQEHLQHEMCFFSMFRLAGV